MLKKILIADSGSSKTDWALLTEASVLKELNTIGLNPDFHDRESLLKVIGEVKITLDEHSVDEVYFYGSGASSEVRKAPLVNAFKSTFSIDHPFVEHDLMGSARAVLGREKGLAAILGTGSNCCFYDGEKVVSEYRSGGYILSDEGGGVYLGKMILKAFIEDYLDAELRKEFKNKHQLDVDDILHALYKEAYPNRFIASFSRFAKEFEDHPQIAVMIKDNFRQFIQKKVLRFAEAKEHSLGIVGSIAIHFEKQLREVVIENEIKLSRISERPIQDLIHYHQLRLAEERS